MTINPDPHSIGLVRVSANALHRLEPLLMTREEAEWRPGVVGKLWGWRVEPCTAGGVLVIATNGRAGGVIHDKTGSARAPATILASEGLRRAITPPKPLTYYYEGDNEDVDLPDACQPGDVLAHHLFVSVYDKEASAVDEAGEALVETYGRALYIEQAEDGPQHSGGYRLTADYPPWREAFERWTPGGQVAACQRLSPEWFNGFQRIARRFETLDLAYSPDRMAPILVTTPDEPDFFGVIMGGNPKVRPAPPPAFPAWFATGEAASAQAPGQEAQG